ncbi:DgyrCDS14868 [Dimorphilus gyrociliatus]|uniref:DgyrCDS14868 n=1 Tax=Dimorphilus gyrociliatus TaxID=2664684 RepID=A0A7I8WF82_9ANNE|nr:DgyrCDS14868 [Dimorphilus gyrociliatus]
MWFFKLFFKTVQLDIDENCQIVKSNKIIDNPNITVRQANDDDIERIVDLFLQGFPFKWKYTFREEEMDEVRKLFIHDFRVAETVIPNTLVAEENGKIVGICQMKYPHVKPMKYGNYRADISFKSVFKVILSSGMLEYLYTMKDDECIIDHLVVDSQCRGKGIGKILLNAADEEAKGRGLKKVCLLVAHHNERAKKLYENWGYIAAKAYYGTKIFMFGDTEIDSGLGLVWVGLGWVGLDHTQNW